MQSNKNTTWGNHAFIHVLSIGYYYFTKVISALVSEVCKCKDPNCLNNIHIYNFYNKVFLIYDFYNKLLSMVLKIVILFVLHSIDLADVKELGIRDLRSNN